MLPLSRSVRLAFLLPLAFLLNGCDLPVVENMQALVAVQRAIVEEVGTDDVGVNLQNGVAMSVNIANSALNDASGEARQAAADRIARIVIDTYADSDELDVLRVTLVSVEQKYLVVTYTQSVDFYNYFRSDLTKLRAGETHDVE